MRQHSNTRYLSFRKWFSDFSLQNKIQLISIACLITLAGASVLITNILLKSYNNLLLDSVSASLSFANDDITQKLDSSYELSYTLLAENQTRFHRNCQFIYKNKQPPPCLLSGTSKRIHFLHKPLYRCL